MAANDVGSRFGAPVGLLFAVVVRRPVVAAPAVVGLWAEHHPALAADRQGALPQVEAGAIEAPLPGLLCRQLGHQEAFLPGRLGHPAG